MPGVRTPIKRGAVAGLLAVGVLSGTAVAEKITGTDDSEVLVGTPGADLIAALGGDDRVDGREGDDRITGGSGDDAVDGEAGNDVVDGGSGADVVSGGPGADELIGGSGDDVILARDGEIDQVTCGSGQDRVEADVADSVAADCETREVPPGERDIASAIRPGKDVGVLAKRGAIKVRRVVNGRPRTVALEALDGVVPFGAQLTGPPAGGTLTLVTKTPDGAVDALTTTFLGPLTVLSFPRLVELRLATAPPRPRTARSAARKRRAPRITAKGKGNFRVRGRYSSATVQGTAFSVTETATTTTTRVIEGRVNVRDLVTRRNVRVLAGGSYVARKRPRTSGGG